MKKISILLLSMIMTLTFQLSVYAVDSPSGNPDYSGGVSSGGGYSGRNRTDLTITIPAESIDEEVQLDTNKERVEGITERSEEEVFKSEVVNEEMVSPKTGESNIVWYIGMASVLLIGGAFQMKKYV